MKLCIYKTWWPPETTLQLGSKVLKLADFTPWPPPEQVGLGLKVEEKKEKKKQDMG